MRKQWIPGLSGRKGVVTRLSVVVLRGYTHVIPAAGTCKKLKESGRIKKLEFTRNMSSHDVKHTLAQNFPDFFASTPSFLKCQDNKLIVFPLKNYPDGEEVLEMSSKESFILSRML